MPAEIVAVAADWGRDTAPLFTAADGLRLLPAGRKTDLPWLGIDQLRITLSQPAPLTAAAVTLKSAKGINYGPLTISGSGTSDFITLARPINKADRITITIGSSAIAGFTRQLDVLPGDFNDDGVVNTRDIKGIRNEWHKKGGAQPTIFGDIVGNGTVNGGDYNAARKRLGTKLPKLTVESPKTKVSARRTGRARFRRPRHPSQRHRESRQRHERQYCGRGCDARRLDLVRVVANAAAGPAENSEPARSHPQ